MALFGRGDIGLAFRKNKQLQQFVLTDVTPTGRILGTGSYGSVEEVKYQYLICAGKKLHETLIEMDNEGVGDIVEKYLQECQLMSGLRHPNITQFLGLCFFPSTRLPLLVMERLEASLDDLLEHMPNLPLSLKRSVLEDVASGLLYLHKRDPSVIHRDLTSKNVLLTTSLVAKITDMGNSRIIDMRPGQMAKTLSQLPGTLVYMPPEALDDRHRYGPSLDIFSFGHLALYTMIQKFPGNLLPSTFCDPYNTGNLQARTEIQRRVEYISLLEAHVGQFHPALIALIKQCLHNVPEERPSTDELLATLQAVKEEVEGEYGASMVKVDVSKMKLVKELKIKDRRLKELMEQQQKHEVELQEKTKELEALKHQLRDEAKSKEAEICKLKEEMVKQKCRSNSLPRVPEENKVPLKLPLQLRWRNGADIPFKMNGYVQSVLLKEVVYIGGGYISEDSDNKFIIMTYNISSGQWDKLLPYKTCNFAMAVVCNQLVLVGGQGRGNDPCKVLGVWSTDGEEWTHPYPDMPTARDGCSAVVFEEWLVVAGGKGASGDRLITVDIMNTGIKQWHAGPPTPVAWGRMKTAIVNDTCYFMGGRIGDSYTNMVYSAYLPALVAGSDPENLSTLKDKIWKDVPQMTIKHAAPLSIGGSLLAVGGTDKDFNPVSFIYLHQFETGEWVKVGHLPTPRYNCTCIMLTDREMLVAGGTCKDVNYIKSVDIAQIHQYTR